MSKMIAYFLVIFLALVTFAFAKEPLEAIKNPMDKSILTLQNPEFKTQRKTQREKLKSIVTDTFDFVEISKRTVATHWKDFSSEQKKQFIDCFSQMLLNSYFQKIQGAYSDEQIVYLGQQNVSDSKAVVMTKIVRKNGEFPINYSLLKTADSWRIYDVVVEGVSLVKNYRAQFEEILLKESPSKLLERLQEKLKEQQDAP